jgi:hypothetical protein
MELFQRDYHRRWAVEIHSIFRFLVSPPAQQPERREDWLLVLAILETTIANMPSGIQIATLERITSCDREDLLALKLIMEITSDSPFKITITGECLKLLPI